MKSVSFNVNGTSREVELQPEQTLLDVLREHAQAQLGEGRLLAAGSVRLLPDADRRPAEELPVMVKADKVAGRSIVTLEGVSDNERQLYADAFQAAAGLQCGFCTPGIVLRIKWLTDQDATAVARRDRRAPSTDICAAAPATPRSSTPSS